MITIREAKESDALALIELRKELFKETTFLLLEPEEYNPTEESEAKFIRMFSSAENCSIFMALNSDLKIVGFMGVAGGTTNRTKHKATVFIGVLSEYWGQGSGKQLFEQLFNWLPYSCLSRIELTTAVNNERAYSLYKKMGFQVEGTKKANISVAGELIDEYQMSYVMVDD